MPEQSPTTESKAATTPSVDLFGAGTGVEIHFSVSGTPSSPLVFVMPLTSLSVLNLPPPSSESTRLGLSPPSCYENCACDPLVRSWTFILAAFCLRWAFLPPTLILFFAPPASVLSLFLSRTLPLCLRGLIRPPCCFTWAFSVARAGSGWRHCDWWVKLLYLDSSAALYRWPVILWLFAFLVFPLKLQAVWMARDYYIYFTPVYLHGAPEHIHMRSNPILPKGARCKDVDSNWQRRGDWMHALISSSSYSAWGMHLGTPVQPNAVTWICK